MSKRSLLSIVTASLVAYSFLFVTSLAIAQDNQDSQMVTFEKATGGTFYALSLKPNVPVNDDDSILRIANNHVKRSVLCEYHSSVQ